MLPRRDADGGIGPKVTGAIDIAHRTGQNGTADLDIVPASNGDAGASACARQGGRSMHIDTDAVQWHTGGLRAATGEGDVAIDHGFALPVHTAVRRNTQVGTRTEQVHVTAADDGIVFDIDDKVGIVLQCGHRAGEQKARAALTLQHMRLHDLYLVDGAIVGGIVGIDQILMGAIGEQPTLGGSSWGIRLRVIHREAGDQLLASGGAGLVVNRRGVLDHA